MRFAVKDDGNGIGVLRLAEIRAHLRSDEVRIEDSFALRTVNSQLALYFNDTEGIRIESAPGAGTVVWFDIPFLSGGDVGGAGGPGGAAGMEKPGGSEGAGEAGRPGNPGKSENTGNFEEGALADDPDGNR
jgi:hypothetical protein